MVLRILILLLVLWNVVRFEVIELLLIMVLVVVFLCLLWMLLLVFVGVFVLWGMVVFVRWKGRKVFRYWFGVGSFVVYGGSYCCLLRIGGRLLDVVNRLCSVGDRD